MSLCLVIRGAWFLNITILIIVTLQPWKELAFVWHCFNLVKVYVSKRRAIYLGHFFFEFGDFFLDSSLLSIVPLFCFSVFLLLCSSAYLLFCFFSFYASLLFLLLCFSAFLLFRFFCFSVFCFSVFFVCFPFFASLYLLLLFGFCFYESFYGFSVCLLLCCFFVSLFLFYALYLFCFRCFLFFYLLPCCSAWFHVQLQHATTTWRTPPAAQTTRAANTKGRTNATKATRTTRTARERRTLQWQRRNTTKVVSVFLGGEVLRPPAPLPMPSSSSFFCCCVLSFLLVLVSLRWCKDDDVNELVNKSRFHNASIITQHGKSPCKNARLKFKNAAQIIFNILQIPCNMKGSIFHMSQMPCKIWGSISTIQVDVAEWWTSGKYRANSVLCFFAFLALIVSQVSSWFCKALQQQQQ